MNNNTYRNAALAIAVLFPVSCDSVKPFGNTPVPKPTVGNISLSIAGGESLLTEAVLDLRVSVFTKASINSRRGEQEGSDYVFESFLTAESPLKVDQLSLGWKLFQLTVTDPDGRVWGRASAQHLVIPGEQSLAAPVTLKLKEPPQETVDASLSIYVGIHTPGQRPKVTYLDLQPLVVKYKCLNCHYGEAPHELGHGLDMTVFPFTSTNDRLPDFSAIADQVSGRIADPTYPMPPAPYPFMEYEESILFEDWTFEGYLERPEGSDETGDIAFEARLSLINSDGEEITELSAQRETTADPFAFVIPAMPVGAMAKFVLKIMARDGQTVLTEELEREVPLDGKFADMPLSIPYRAGELTIPIVVEPDTAK